mmetsp:Transcript_41861/g.100579  ORF Transcript_41861/g.100579 Transcript_41861/m.100579 type:complete len:310 (+) Transcript_41861:88-1017(+)
MQNTALAARWDLQLESDSDAIVLNLILEKAEIRKPFSIVLEIRIHGPLFASPDINGDVQMRPLRRAHVQGTMSVLLCGGRSIGIKLQAQIFHPARRERWTVERTTMLCATDPLSHVLDPPLHTCDGHVLLHLERPCHHRVNAQRCNCDSITSLGPADHFLDDNTDSNGIRGAIVLSFQRAKIAMPLPNGVDKLVGLHRAMMITNKQMISHGTAWCAPEVQGAIPFHVATSRIELQLQVSEARGVKKRAPHALLLHEVGHIFNPPLHPCRSWGRQTILDVSNTRLHLSQLRRQLVRQLLHLGLEGLQPVG